MDIKKYVLSIKPSKFEIIYLVSVGLFGVTNFVHDWSIMICQKWRPKIHNSKLEISQSRHDRELATPIILCVHPIMSGGFRC